MELKTCVPRWLLQGNRDSMRKYLGAKGQQTQLASDVGFPSPWKLWCTPLRSGYSTESKTFADDLRGKGGKPITKDARLTSSQMNGTRGAATRRGSVLGRRQERRQGAGCADGSAQPGRLSTGSFYLHFRPRQNVWCYPWNHIWTEPC